MSIKILQSAQRRPTEKPIYRGTCIECRCHVECDYEDLIRSPTGEVQGKAVKCPTEECPEYIGVSQVRLR